MPHPAPNQVHPSSPIIDFYPIDFADDLNGKKYAWQAIALLPFIDAPRLKAAVGPLRATLTAEEADRDGARGNLLFVAASHPSAALLAAPNARPLPAAIPLDSTAAASHGFGGRLALALLLALALVLALALASSLSLTLTFTARSTARSCASRAHPSRRRRAVPPT